MASLSRHLRQASRFNCCTAKCSQIRLSSLQTADSNTITRSRIGIEIPNKIERDPTDILKALASAVKTNSNGPHYKFIDDPWLIPTSPREKRDYALARASGKKAAQWIIGNYPRHFEHDQAEPKIEAFNPHHYNNPRISEVCENGLKERINLRMPKEAFEMYTQLKDAGRLGEVSQLVQEELLTLLAWFGGLRVSPNNSLLQEEAFFRMELTANHSRTPQRTWSDNNPAEEVFASLPEKTCSAYCILIKGMSKHLEYEKPFLLLEEMKQRNMQVPLEVWNALIPLAPRHCERSEERVQAVLNVLRQMAACGIKPSLQTFNNTLQVVRRLSRFRNSAHVISAILQEMRKCRVEPSLGTWTSIILYFYAKDDVDSPMLHTIMDQVERTELRLLDPSDVEFFSTAMHRCQLHVKDIELAWRIHKKLCQTGHNQSLFLGDAYREMLYYNTFFRLLCMLDTLENAMKIYTNFVPHVWVPQWTTMEGLFDAIELQEEFHYLPQIWADLVQFGYWKRVELTGRLLQLMAKKQHPSELQAQFGDAVDTLLIKAQEDAERGMINTLQLDGSMLGDMIVVLIEANRFDSAWSLFMRLCSKTGSLGGLPSVKSLQSLGSRCIENENFSSALRVLRYLCEMEYSEAASFADRIKDGLTLDDSQLQEVESLL